MKKARLNAVFVVLTFCACVLVICWSAVKIDRAITVSEAVPEDRFMIILDAGHDASVLTKY